MTEPSAWWSMCGGGVFLNLTWGVLLVMMLGAPLWAQRGPLVVEHGTYTVHLLLHSIGTEEYTVTDEGAAGLRMAVTTTVNDRGMVRTASATLAMATNFTPSLLTQTTCAGGAVDTLGCSSRAELTATSATVEEGPLGLTRTVKRPPVAFVGFSSMPASLQMMMMRYWALHHRPAALPILRASDKALPVEIRLAGHDAFEVKGRMVRLARYTVANLLFGREVLWMNDSNRLVALMTFAGGLPQEELLDGYEPVAGEIVRSGVRQQMLDLDELTRRDQPMAVGSFAIVGAQLIDGTGAAAVADSVVVVRDGLIADAGAAGIVHVPAGVRVIHAEGKSLLPGLWEVHLHYSGVAFGPALLAAGITTARDCGGENGFLLALRDRLDHHAAVGPRLLLAGLIDSGGALAFGPVQVETPAQAVTAVDNYADWGFEQIKVYTQIEPEVLRAISAEAHRRGMTVTGHVPAAVDAFGGVADGMDQINHLQFVTRAMGVDPATGKVDLGSERARRLIALLKEKQIVVDPTLGWGEMAGRPRGVDPASFEPGLKAAPFTLAAKYRSMGTPNVDAAKFQQRTATNLEVVKALSDAGVSLVAGSDTGLPGYGLDRELELYVQAGMSPMAAIQTATLGAARAMKLEKVSGSIEVGKQADLLLVEGDPLREVRDLRRTVLVVKAGRVYNTRTLAASVGFHR